VGVVFQRFEEADVTLAMSRRGHFPPVMATERCLARGLPVSSVTKTAYVRIVSMAEAT
jgi:hypothetical protein